MDFLSHAAIVGFMGGAAIIIGLQQLKGLIGISHFTNKTDVVSVLRAVFRSFHDEAVSFSTYFRLIFRVFILLISVGLVSVVSYEFYTWMLIPYLHPRNKIYSK